MRDIDIAVSTISRPEDYLDITLQSLGVRWPISLCVGSPSASYLDAYRSNDKYSVIDVREEEWTILSDKHVWHRASWNYWRCLSSNNIFNNGVIIFEDDIVASRDWRERLESTIDAIEASYGQNYVLSLYSAYKRDSYKQGSFFEEYVIDQFFGTQGMYFTEKTRLEYARFIHHFGVLSYHMPYDLLLKHYLVRMRVPLFSTTPSLVQHIGRNTTGLGGNFHQAPSFLP